MSAIEILQHQSLNSDIRPKFENDFNRSGEDLTSVDFFTTLNSLINADIENGHTIDTVIMNEFAFSALLIHGNIDERLMLDPKPVNNSLKFPNIPINGQLYTVRVMERDELIKRHRGREVHIETVNKNGETISVWDPIYKSYQF